MGRWSDRKSNPESSYSAPDTISGGRWKEMTASGRTVPERGTSLRDATGRWQERRKQEEEFLKSEEGQRLMAEIQQQIIDQQQKEFEAQSYDAIREERRRAGLEGREPNLPEETDITRSTRAQTAMDFEQQLLKETADARKTRAEQLKEQYPIRGSAVARFFTPKAFEPKVAADTQDPSLGTPYLIGEARKRSREQFEADLKALGMNDEEIKTYSGIDPQVYEDLIKELSTGSLAKQAKDKSIYYLGATVDAFAKNEYDVRLPFGTAEQTGKIRGLHSKIIAEIVSRGIFELIPRATVVASANYKSIYNQIMKGDKVTDDDLSVVLPFKAERLGLYPENLGGEENAYRVADSGTRLFKRWAQLASEDPKGNYMLDGFRAAWDTAILDVLDAWATEELAKVTLNTMSQSQKARLQQNLQVLGYSSDDIANMSDDFLRETLKTKVANRMDDIINMGDDFITPEGVRVKMRPEALTAGTPDETWQVFNNLVKEGSFNAVQAAEAQRLANALGNLGIVLQNGKLTSIPKIVQASNTFATGMTANLTGQAGRTGRAGEYATGVFRQRPAGSPPRSPRLGLSIEDISRLPLPDDARQGVQSFMKQVDSNANTKDWQYGYNTENNAITLTSDEYARAEARGVIPEMAQAARENGLNFGKYDEATDAIDLDIAEFGFDTDLAEEIARREASLRARRAQDIESVAGLGEDSALLDNVANLNISQQQLFDTLGDVATGASGGAIPAQIARELLNTPAEARVRVTEPIRRSALTTKDPFQEAILNTQDDLALSYAEIARRFEDPTDFTNLFGFLADARTRPNVEFPGRNIFNTAVDKANIIDELTGLGFLTEDDISRIFKAEIPTSIIDNPSPERLRLAESVEEAELMARFGTASAQEQLIQVLNDAVNLRRSLNTLREPTPDVVLSALQDVAKKPDLPVFAILNDGRALLLSKNARTRQTVAAAKAGGVETVPGFVIDYKGNLTEFKKFLGSNSLSLSQFAQKAKTLPPSLIAKGGKKDVKLMREEAGLLSGRLTKVGTSDINSVVIPTKHLRNDIPQGEPVIYNGMLFRDRFDVPGAEIAGLGGLTRDVYALGPDAVVKVAKNKQGIVQNLQSYNYHAITHGLIPRIFEGGQNYIVTERFAPLPARGIQAKAIQAFVEGWENFVRANADRMVSRFDGVPIEELTGQEQYLYALEMDEFVWEYLDEWRNSDDMWQLVTDDGVPLFEWDELARYRVAMGDIAKESSWGVRPDGRLVLIDEGALDIDTLDFIRRAGDKSWTAYTDKFDDIVRGSKESKAKFKDHDPHTNYSFFVPGFTEDEEGEYGIDPFQTALYSIFASLGMRRVGGGKGPRRRQGAQAKNLPQSTPTHPKLLPTGKAIMNSDAFKAKTGQAFGAVLPRPQIPKGPGANITNGVRTLDSTKMLAPLGDDANYVFLDKDVAYMHGKYDMYVATGDNVLVIDNDNTFRQLVAKAGIDNLDLIDGVYANTRKNIAEFRKFLEAEGYDGVIVRFEQKNGPTGHLEHMFEYEQFINFNPKNFVRTKGSGIQKTTKGTRAKKAQRQIMNVIEPPATKTMIDEKVELRRRLRELNRTIKEGKKLGAAEARVSITAQLRNFYGIKIENIRRNQELMRLRQRILDRQGDVIKKQLVDYAKEVLPTTMSREFLAERGKLINSIATTRTPLEMYKKMKAIDNMRERVEKKLITVDIKKTFKRVVTGQTVAADYRTMMREFMGQFDLVKRRPSTVKNMVKMRNWVDEQKRLGNDVTITEGMLEQMEILARQDISQLSVAELKNVLAKMQVLEQVGRNKAKIRERLWKAERQQRADEIYRDLRPIERKAMIEPATPWGKLSLEERVKNFIASVTNTLRMTDMSITPTDTVFDLMGSGTARFDEGPYRYLKEIHDTNFRGVLQDLNKMNTEWIAMEERLGLKDENFIRIGIHLARAEGEQTIERMVANGIPRKVIDELQLTSQEMEMAMYIRENLDAERPWLSQMANELYNKEFFERENYFPMLADFSKMGDMNAIDRFGNTVPLMQRTRRNKVKVGSIEVRNPLAKAPIQVDARKVFFQHKENILYMKHMARDVKMVGEIVNTEEFAKKAGDIGALMARDYMDLLARNGGADNQQMIWVIDTLNRNSGIAMLGFKLSSAMIQMSALPQGAALIGGRYTAMGVKGFTSNHDIRKFIINNMPEVRETIVDDIGFLDRPSLDSLGKIQDMGYSALKYLDSITRSSVAWGAYLKKLDELGEELDMLNPNMEAIKYAERVVRMTQASSLWKDAPLAISRGTGVTGNRSVNRAFFKFQSYTLTSWSLLRHTALGGAIRGGAKGRKQALEILFWTIVAMMLEEGLRNLSNEAENLITGKEDEEEDGFTMKMANNFLGRVPFVNHAMSVMMYDSFPVPAWNGIEKMFSGAHQAYSGASTETKVKGGIDVFTGAGTIIGLPGMFQTRTLLRDYIDGADGSTETSPSIYGDRPDRPERPERPTRPTRPERPGS